MQKFYLLENPLNKANSGGNNITNLITLDDTWDGTLLYGFDSGALYVAGTWVAGLGWAEDDVNKAVMPPGKGFYLYPTKAGTVTFVGEVAGTSAAGNGVTNTLTGGSKFNLVGSAFPAAQSLTAMGLTGADGDIVYRYNTAQGKLTTVTFVAGLGWYDDTVANGGPVEGPSIDVGEGFFYFNPNTDFVWKQFFTVQ
jgi:hypothetical protein